ncbi:Uncharacterised protein [Candidatus Bilamarchaeum dharawalense]|uniref:Uncharacterized protein n=1 Tax=Candidatus Bilamarchaeum dharawalense TaxID=2885759 RepID=A0A5E4LSV1_9ARCH|nr:Uncharacterised protein [Candidatus Bilamarchaeum dharawalense]
MNFIAAYTLTVLIETVALFILLRKKYETTTILKNGFVASTVTLPFVWFVFPLLGFGWTLTFVFSEVFAIVVEAIWYKLAFKQMGYGNSLVLSLICNLLSIVAGLLLS